MFRKMQESVPQLEKVLIQNPGLAVGGELELIRNIQKLIIYFTGLAKSAGSENTQSADYLQQVRLTLLSLDKAIGHLGQKNDIICSTMDRDDLVQVTKGFKVLLSGLKSQIEVMKDAMPKEIAPGVGTKAELVQELQAREGKETSTVQFAFDGLDTINRREGREVGDQVLAKIARLIQEMGGDSTKVYQDGPGFVAVGDWGREDEVKQFSDKVTLQMRTVPKANTLQLVIGVVLNETENVLEKTNLATEQSEGPPVLFSPRVAQEKEAQRQEHELAVQILEEKDFFPEYQEIFTRGSALFAKGPRKFEVLWRSPRMSPFKFFSAIKDEGRIAEVTAQLLPMVFANLQGKPHEVAINVTPEELGYPLENDSFADYLLKQAAKYGISRDNIILELVEWSGEDHLSDESLETLVKLKKAGCKLALDDYGVRSSNLVRLMQLCEHGLYPEFIKIDAALVKGLNRLLKEPANERRFRHNIIGIRSIVELVKELRRETKIKIGIVAEFVDNQALLKSLEKLGVTHYQGFFLAKPLPAEKVF